MEQHLSQYRIFYEVAKAGNISKAAKGLFISQPAISKAISKLEENLDVTLFTRNSRGVQLTSEGELLFQYVENAFEALDRGENELKRIREFHIGQLTIGVSNTLCKYLLLPYLKDFIEEHPHVKVAIESQATARTLDMLEQQRIDIGLVAEPRNQRGLNFLPVAKIEDIFVCTPSYLKNLKLREGQEADVFRTGNIMLLDRNNMTRHYIDAYLNENQIVPNQLLEVTTMDLLIEFARIGLGVGCVIREFVAGDLAAGRLIEIPLSAPIRKRTVGFAYQENRQNRILKSFVTFLEARVGR